MLQGSCIQHVCLMWIQDGTKIELGWHQDGTKMAPKWHQGGTKMAGE